MRSRLTLTALALLIAVPAVALAAKGGGLPKPKDPQINPPTELAGIELGMSMDKARRQWGKRRGDCEKLDDGLQLCNYGDINRRGVAGILASDGKVDLVAIQLPLKRSGKAEIKGPLMDLISMEGIGLGSKMKDVKEAYPDVKKLPDGNGYMLLGPRKSAMTFAGTGTLNDRKVTVITLSSEIPESSG